MTESTDFARIYLDCDQAAAMVGTCYGSLARWRHFGVGPDFLKSGDGTIRYRYLDVLRWMAKENRFLRDGRFAADVLADIEKIQPPEPTVQDCLPFPARLGEGQ